MQSTDIEALLRRPTPREVPEELVQAAFEAMVPWFARIVFRSLPVLMLVASVLPVGMLLAHRQVRAEWRLWRGPTARTSGVIKKIDQRTHKGRESYVYEFEFHPAGEPDSSMVRGFSFSDQPVYEAEQTAEVEYSPADPTAARLKGMRTSPISPKIFLLLLANCGLVVLIPIGVLRFQRRRYRRLFALGQPVPARVTGDEPGLRGGRRILLAFTLNDQEKTVKFEVVPYSQAGKKLIGMAAERGETILLVNPAKPTEVFPLSVLGGE